MTVSPRTQDELQHAPYMATLPALSACIQAVSVALDIAHPDLLSRLATTPVDMTALVLRLHLDECQQLLRHYDELLFEAYVWSDALSEDHGEPPEPDDDIPF